MSSFGQSFFSQGLGSPLKRFSRTAIAYDCHVKTVSCGNGTTPPLTCHRFGEREQQPMDYRRFLSIFESQSKPSKRPSPLMADVLKIDQSRLLISDSPKPSATWASDKAPATSCICKMKQVRVQHDMDNACQPHVALDWPLRWCSPQALGGSGVSMGVHYHHWKGLCWWDTSDLDARPHCHPVTLRRLLVAWKNPKYHALPNVSQKAIYRRPLEEGFGQNAWSAIMPHAVCPLRSAIKAAGAYKNQSPSQSILRFQSCHPSSYHGQASAWLVMGLSFEKRASDALADILKDRGHTDDQCSYALE